jgi:hypothetical protein
VLRRALPLALSAALVVATAACGGGDDEGSAATTAPTTEAPTTTAPTDPFAVPAEIDEAYVERVVNELYRVAGDALRGVVQAGEVTPEARAQLSTVFTEDNVDGFVSEFEYWVQVDFEPLERPPGDIISTVQQIRVAQDSCISAEVQQDLSAVVTDPDDPGPLVAVLRGGDGAAAGGENPTPWRLDGVYGPDGFDEELDGCAAE